MFHKEEVEKHLYPFLRARIHKFCGTCPPITTSTSILTWSASDKALVLCNICDWIAEEHAEIHDIAFRSAGLGLDDELQPYWFFGDAPSCYRIYRIDNDGELLTVCDSLDEMMSFADTLLPPPISETDVVLPKKKRRASSSYSKPKSRKVSQLRDLQSQGGSVALGAYLKHTLIPQLKRKEQGILRAETRAERQGLDLNNIIDVAYERPRRGVKPARYNYDDAEEDFDDECMIPAFERPRRFNVKPSRYNFDEKDDDEQVEDNQESSSDESVSQSETTEPLPAKTENIEIETSECEHVEI